MTSWKSKSACAPCAGAKEGSDGEVSPTQPSQQEVRKCPQPYTHTDVLEEQSQSHFHSMEMKYHTALSCCAFLNSMDNKRTRLG